LSLWRPLVAIPLVLVAAALLATPAPSMAANPAAKDVISFRIGHNEPLGSPMNDAFEQWVKVLKEKSNGRLNPSNFPAGQTGNYLQNIEANRLGTIEISSGGLDTEGKIAPIVAVLGLGYIVTSYDDVDKVYQGPLGKLLSEEAKKKTNVYFIAYGEAGFRHVVAKKPVRSMADLKGVKMRVPETPIAIRLFQLMGTNPTPVAYSELYTALQTGVVDAAENPISDILGHKFYEPAPHIALTGHQFNAKAIRLNARWFDSLPADLQQIIRDTAVEVFAKERADSRQREAGNIQKLKDLGVKFYEVDKKPLVESVTKQHEEYVKEYPEAADIMKRVKALQ